MKRFRFFGWFAVVLLLAACATSPLGRKQLRFFPEQEMEQMGAAAYQQIQQQVPPTEDPAVQRYVACVATAITAQLPENSQAWTVTVFEDPSANAFALPGGNIGVNTGLLNVAKTQSQLAAVIGHEIAHVLAEHSNERMSTAYATQAGLQIVESLRGGPSPQNDQLMALLGVGAQLGVILPFSRTQEREADLLGLDLMAKAGFDPAESIQLWRNMSESNAPGAPEFLSTHPSSGTRIDDLRGRLKQAQDIYRQAQAQGIRPNCRF